MPLLLRKLRKPRWTLDKDLPWLAEGDIPADPLSDLATSENKLSVFLVEDDRSNLDQVVTAVAATRGHLAVFDYALFDQQLLPQLNIKIESTDGGTLDQVVNSWHRDLVELSALKLVELAKAILANAEKNRVLEKKIGQLMAQAVSLGRIDGDQLTPETRSKIAKHIQ